MSKSELMCFWPIALIGVVLGLYSSYKSIMNNQTDFLILSLVILVASAIFLFLLKSELKRMNKNKSGIFKYTPMFVVVSFGVIFFVYLFSKNT